MSFLDDIVGFLGSNSIGSSLVKTAISGFVLNRVQNSITKENEARQQAQEKDFGVREQVDPDTDHSIPVVYGDAFVSGVITDAELTNDNKTMWYCVTLAEKTGTLINGTASVITFKEVYWNNLKLSFKSDGVTVGTAYGEDGEAVTNLDGLVKFYPFNGNSDSPTNFTGSGNTTPAYNLFPNWTSNHDMSELIFCLVRVDYNKEKGATGIGNLRFKLSNTMRQPGDVLNDYMTNERYGAGIPPAEINAS